MQVKELCSRPGMVCGLDTDLARAGRMMSEENFGVLPVVDMEGKVVGMITDRDICLAGAERPRPLSEIPAREVMSGKVFSASPCEDVREALQTMRLARVRRLPVLDEEGRLEGILSLDDVAIAAVPDKNARGQEITYEDLALTLKTICVCGRYKPRSLEREKSPKGVR